MQFSTNIDLILLLFTFHAKYYYFSQIKLKKNNLHCCIRFSNPSLKVLKIKSIAGKGVSRVEDRLLPSVTYTHSSDIDAP